MSSIVQINEQQDVNSLLVRNFYGEFNQFTVTFYADLLTVMISDGNHALTPSSCTTYKLATIDLSRYMILQMESMSKEDGTKKCFVRHETSKSRFTTFPYDRKMSDKQKLQVEDDIHRTFPFCYLQDELKGTPPQHVCSLYCLREIISKVHAACHAKIQSPPSSPPRSPKIVRKIHKLLKVNDGSSK